MSQRGARRVNVSRLRVSPSMVVAFIALAAALGGTSYAAIRLPARSVGAKQLRSLSVTKAKIAAGAVDGSKVGDESLTGQDIQEATLGQVPSAVNATNASNSTHAGSSAGIDKIVYRGVNVVIPPAPSAGTPATVAASAPCDPGQRVVGGGAKVEDPSMTSIADTYPDAGGTIWTVHADNNDTVAHGLTVFAICVPAATIG